jgi:hypothetical protein
MKLWAEWGFRRSEKEIIYFLDSFSQGSVEENGAILGMAALQHYQIKAKDPGFSELLNSKKGENQGPICLYILQLNRLLNGLYKSGRYVEGDAMMLWNVTFRCMSRDSFHHHGVVLWQIASKSIDEARKCLEKIIVSAVSEAGNSPDDQKIDKVLGLCNFIPPQFMK